jgi:hypothetical protein
MGQYPVTTGTAEGRCFSQTIGFNCGRTIACSEPGDCVVFPHRTFIGAGSLMHTVRHKGMLVLTINNGAMAMDGGSICLEAVDASGQPWRVSLDWSIAAQRAGNTSLSINGTKLQAGGAEEADWIEILCCADIAGAEDCAPSPPPAQKRIVLAPDAKVYLDAIDKRPHSALLALRDDLLEKLQSPQHRQQLPESSSTRRSGRLPLP